MKKLVWMLCAVLLLAACQNTSNNAAGHISSAHIEVPSDSAAYVGDMSMFNNIYAKFVAREYAFDYDSVLQVTEASGYQVETMEPAGNVTTHFKLLDNVNEGDYLYFAFHLINEETETLMTLSYFHAAKNAEASLHNASDDAASEYDMLRVHLLGGSAQSVSGIEEQRAFLFAR